ncbi:MAG TPA: metallophosphoesterase [Thermodesulfovibrionia bacterium]|nr:metallophosphoesterase [Thermodesulfovibrionia bacterium]
MSDISYVSLSDMHLGEEDSLLSVPLQDGNAIDPLQASPVMKRLADCLAELIKHNQKKKPVLVLNGDILELALCTTNNAAMVFDRFIELTMKKDADKEPLFEEIIFIPGNHDHHIWEVARESQYVNYLQKANSLNSLLEDARHTTNLFFHRQKIKVPSVMLTNLLQRHQRAAGFEHLGTKEINVFYPNLGFVNEDGTRCVIFSHGHYIESIYNLMTNVKETLFPAQKRLLKINEIETENFAWVDFFWSALGRQGDAGRDVEIVYEKIQYEKGRADLINKLSAKLADMIDIPLVWDRLEPRLIASLIKLMVDIALGERSKRKEFLSEESEKGFKAFMEHPLYMQIIQENKKIPQDLTFVFGHTHKPFQDVRQFEGYPGRVKVYNTGGWVVENPIDRDPLIGASVVLVDDELNTTSIRLYNEAQSMSDYKVKVEQADSQANNQFHNRIKALVDSDLNKKWQAFSKEAAFAVEQRALNMKRRAEKAGYL